MRDSHSQPVNVYLSAGSNIAPIEHLKLACERLQSEYGPLTLSSVYQNPAVGFEGDDFLNMVIGFSTTDEPEKIVEKLEEVHDTAKRETPGEPVQCKNTGSGSAPVRRSGAAALKTAA